MKFKKNKIEFEIKLYTHDDEHIIAKMYKLLLRFEITKWAIDFGYNKEIILGKE